VLRAGSIFDFETNATYGAVGDIAEIQRVSQETKRKNLELTLIKDLVKMHMSKQKDDQTTRFLFAASRGDVDTITLMCDQGFDVNSSDYDNRTALMVASMKASDAVKALLECGADPNITDVHGTTALHEAVKNGHEQTMDLLLSHGATLCMAESLAASVICQAVFDGDILFLRRLLRAGIPVNSADYDKRTAAHIAAAEGNVAALKVLIEFGADLTLEDRWGNTVDHEAQRSKSGRLVEYLRVHRESISEP
jgi:ankyrin repeat protein